MSHQIIKQPDGRLAVWSSGVDDWIMYDASPDEVVEFFVTEAADRARDAAQETVGAVVADQAASVYYQFAMTFAEAQEWRAEVHGSAPWPPGR